MKQSTDNGDQEPARILDLIRGVRRAPGQTGDYAPHKALMLLIALARIQHNEQRLAPFDEVEPKLRELLRDFARTGAEKTRHLPYWRLKNDHGGALWQLQDPSHEIHIAAIAPPSLGQLRKSKVQGGFSTQVHETLRKDPELLRRAAQIILDETFPESLQADIENAVGLDLRPDNGILREAQPPAGYRVSNKARKPRDPAFREDVLRAYEYRCCVCGFNLRVGHIPAGLEAAHIQWHTVGGPDIVTNGLALCALHHKLFDLGAFTVEVGQYRILFSEHAIAGDRSVAGELRHHGQLLLAPQHARLRPAQDFLRWNFRNIFKQPARE